MSSLEHISQDNHDDWSEPTYYYEMPLDNEIPDIKAVSEPEQLVRRYLFGTSNGMISFNMVGTFYENDVQQTLFLGIDAEGNRISKITPTNEVEMFTEIISLQALERYTQQVEGRRQVTESDADWSTPKVYDYNILKGEDEEDSSGEEPVWGTTTYYAPGIFGIYQIRASKARK